MGERCALLHQPFALIQLYNQPEKTLWYLFVKKLLTGPMGAIPSLTATRKTPIGLVMELRTFLLRL